MWSERLSEFAAINSSIPIYFLIGTDVDDQPILNRQKLYDALDEKLKLNWNKVFGSHDAKQLSLTNFFKRKEVPESKDSDKNEPKASKR